MKNLYCWVIVGILLSIDVSAMTQYSSCQYKFTKERGVIKSPGFPQPYPHHLKCSWQIIVPVGKRIILRPKIFDIEHSYNCAMDVLYIYDGPNENSKLFERPFCDGDSIKEINSTGNSLFLRFITDRLDNAKGFMMEYHSTYVCRFTFNQSTGYFTSPNFPRYYKKGTNCSYLITTQKNKAIQLKFHDFELEGKKANGECMDHMRIYDIIDGEHRLVKQLCGSATPLPIRSASNKMLIKFHSDDLINKQGFNISYQTVFHLCETNEFKCANGRCIPVTLLCNKVNDCLDNTDEVFCNCKPRFKCKNHRCIGRKYVCDGKNHCGDWSDEKHCDEREKMNQPPTIPTNNINQPTTIPLTIPTTVFAVPTCGTTQYKCRNNRCISSSKRCNGHDECGDNSDESDCEGLCRTLNGGCMHICHFSSDGVRTCSCYNGFKLDSDGKSCIDINECSSRPCAYDPLCQNTPGSYKCGCPKGYVLSSDQHNCTDFDECTLQNGDCQQQCINSIGGRYCACFKGYMNDKLTDRCVDIDECKINNGGCQERCVNTVGNYTCACNKPGYAMTPTKTTCQEVDECSLGTAKCAQICLNTDGSYECGCKNGYRLDYYQQDCEDINECLEGVPQCNGCENTLGSFYCRCGSGYQSIVNDTKCVDVNECEDRNGGCSDICRNTVGSFFCKCNPGFVKRDPSSFTCEDRNECKDKPCEQVCINTLGSFKCSCRPGYELANRTHCIDINECGDVKANGCQGSCTNTPGSFYCTCPDGSILGRDHSTCHVTKNTTGTSRCPNLAIDIHSISKTTWTKALKGWAWQASLTLHFQILNIPLFKCMGVLVHKAYVLTTGHCLKFGNSIAVDADRLMVALGNVYYDYNSSKERVRVNSIIFHGTLDLVLLRLSRDIPVSSGIQPICLSEYEHDVNQNLVAATWFSSEREYNLLQQIYASEVDPVNCKRSSMYQLFQNTSMCMKIADRRALLPMSGSALLGKARDPQSSMSRDKNQKWYLAGLLVYGGGNPTTRRIASYSSYKYLTYARASSFSRWILDTIKQNGNDDETEF